MSIPIKCQCGRHMKVKDSKAGKKIRCPNCGHGVRVPIANPDTDDQIKALKDWVRDTDRAQRDAGRATPTPSTRSSRRQGGAGSATETPPPQNKAPVHKTASSKAATKQETPWLYIGALGAVVVLGGLVWLVFLRS